MEQIDAALEADIARVAARRGVSVRDVQVRARERAVIDAENARAARERALDLLLDSLRQPLAGSIVEQMEAFDGLPERSRAFLASLPFDISARRYRMALDHLDGDEGQLMERITTALAHTGAR